MGLDGGQTDAQQLTDLGVGAVDTDQPQHLQFRLGQGPADGLPGGKEIGVAGHLLPHRRQYSGHEPGIGIPAAAFQQWKQRAPVLADGPYKTKLPCSIQGGGKVVFPAGIVQAIFRHRAQGVQLNAVDIPAADGTVRLQRG